MTWRLALASAVGGAAAWLTTACADRAVAGDRPLQQSVHGRSRGVSSGDVAGTIAESALAIRNMTREPGALATVVAVTVRGWTGPGGRPFEVTLRTPGQTPAHARRFGTVTLRNSARTRAPNVGQYPCTSCHLGKRLTMSAKRVRDAHQNIKAPHPVQTGGACSTCHAADNVELLALKSGERATLDHTYRLCAQCHFSQADAWASGAHGKRLDGWQGRRVVMGCADCHDPHKPAIEPRIPFRAPRIERVRGHDE